MNALTEGDCRRTSEQEPPDSPYAMARGFRDSAWAATRPNASRIASPRRRRIIEAD